MTESIVGVLALQGDFQEHIEALKTFTQKTPLLVKYPQDLDAISHLIIPGGESTVIGKLLSISGLDKAIIDKVKNQKLKIYGTCAGAILLAETVNSPTPVNNLNLISIKISRNSYGSQIDSFQGNINLENGFFNKIKDFWSIQGENNLKSEPSFESLFIRAPKVLSWSKDSVRVLAFYKQDPVLLESENILISTFHPELNKLNFIHQYFLYRF